MCKNFAFSVQNEVILLFLSSWGFYLSFMKWNLFQILLKIKFGWDSHLWINPEYSSEIHWKSWKEKNQVKVRFSVKRRKSKKKEVDLFFRLTLSYFLSEFFIYGPDFLGDFFHPWKKTWRKKKDFPWKQEKSRAFFFHKKFLFRKITKNFPRNHQSPEISFSIFQAGCKGNFLEKEKFRILFFFVIRMPFFGVSCESKKKFSSSINFKNFYAFSPQKSLSPMF